MAPHSDWVAPMIGAMRGVVVLEWEAVVPLGWRCERGPPLGAGPCPSLGWRRFRLRRGLHYLQRARPDVSAGAAGVRRDLACPGG
jgi:hypothetical protein